jgi:hypothetical protein
MRMIRLRVCYQRVTFRETCQPSFARLFTLSEPLIRTSSFGGLDFVHASHTLERVGLVVHVLS